MDIQNLIASIQLADLQRRGFFKPPMDIRAIARASKQVSNLIYADDIDRDAGGEPVMAEPSLVTIMDPPDVWGVRHNMGLAELAARLGSIVTFDRRGDVLWFDDFESGYTNWALGFVGAGAAAAWDASYPFRGGFDIHLNTGATANNSAWISCYLAYPVISKMGLEMALSFDNNIKYVELTLALHTGARMHEMQLRWTEATKTWRCKVGVAAFQDLIPTQNFTRDVRTHHVFKLVGDFTTGKYVRLVSDSIGYDLSSYNYNEVGSGVAPTLLCILSIMTRNNAEMHTYLDHIIVTQNEPA